MDTRFKRMIAVALLAGWILGCDSEPRGAGAGLDGNDSGIASDQPQTGARTGPNDKSGGDTATDTRPPDKSVQRVPATLAHLREIKGHKPDHVFRIRDQDASVVGQLSDVLLDAQGQRARFAVLYLADNVAQHRPFIIAPWEALTIDTNTGDLFVSVRQEKLRQMPVVKPQDLPRRVPPGWGAEFYPGFGVQPREVPADPEAAGAAALISGAVKGSGVAGERKAVVDANRGNLLFIVVGLLLAIFAITMIVRGSRSRDCRT